jgi:hypothetical protein
MMPATEREPARHSSATDKSVFVLVKSFYESAAADDVASVGRQTHPRIAAIANAVVALSSVPIVDPPVQRCGAAAAIADLYRPPETVDAAYGCRRCRKLVFLATFGRCCSHETTVADVGRAAPMMGVSRGGPYRMMGSKFATIPPVGC